MSDVEFERRFAAQKFDTPHYGWLEASPEKRALHQTKYLWSHFVPETVASVNVINTIPAQFPAWYNQDGKNACVAADSAQAMAFMNFKHSAQSNTTGGRCTARYATWIPTRRLPAPMTLARSLTHLAIA